MKTTRHKQKSPQNSVPTSVTKLARRLSGEWLPKVHRLLSRVPADDVVEWTHQLRVATRRADVVLRLFRHWIPAEHRQRMQRTLRRIRTEAGAVRDLDLLLERFPIPTVSHASDAELVSWLHEQWKAQRLQSWDELRKWTRRSALCRFQEQSESLIDRVRWKGDDKQPGMDGWCSRTVSKMLRIFEESLEKCGADFASCHRARINGRRLRYALEMLVPVATSPQTQDFCEELASVQDVLGQINDDATAIHFLDAASSDCTEAEFATALHRLLEETQALASRRLAEWNDALPGDDEGFADAMHQMSSDQTELAGG